MGQTRNEYKILVGKREMIILQWILGQQDGKGELDSSGSA